MLGHYAVDYDTGELVGGEEEEEVIEEGLEGGDWELRGVGF